MEDCMMERAYLTRLQHQESKCAKGMMKSQLSLMGRERRREVDRENVFVAKKLCFDEEDEDRRSNCLFSSPTADRYIPLRSSGDIRTRFGLLTDTSSPTSSKTKKHPKSNGPSSSSTHHQQNHNNHHHHHGNSSSIAGGGGGAENNAGSETPSIYSSLLHNELVNNESDENCRPGLFKYSANLNSPLKTNSPMIDSVHPYSLSPVSTQSQLLLRSPRKPTRRISRIPFKVLDAPELQDDFYLNLVDWSSSNVLSVGLASCVYLWSAATSQVTRLCDLSTAESNSVTSVSWNERGNLVAVGTNHGYVEIWDAGALKQVAKLQGHSARVGTLAWNGDVLSSGSRDRIILQRDIRVSPLEFERRLCAHRQEVCGLKWSPDNQYLASGGNDNRLHVWNMQSTQPVATYDEHIAAVKAIAWSPHHHGLLASGGGTADRTIRFWNTLTGQAIQSVDTGSQVCNLAWSKHSSELVSTHGYSQNQILVWKYPSLAQVSKLTGHTYRVLYLAMSPCGESIVTGAGDETLRFWNVFSKATLHRSPKSQLSLFQNIR